MHENHASSALRRPSPSNRSATLAKERTGEWRSYKRIASRVAAGARAEMTAASSPIVVSVSVSVLALMVSIAAMLMTRANVRWQMQVTMREAWRREFREKVAVLLASEQLLAGRHCAALPLPNGVNPRLGTGQAGVGGRGV